MTLQIIILIVFIGGVGALLLYTKIADADVIAFCITVGIVLSSIIVGAGWSLIKADKLSFNEYWNGYEKEAIFLVQGCSRDSGCNYVYNCDPYQQAHTSTSTDSKGHVTTTTYYTTEYHHCPYVTEEWIFYVDTTLDKYFIAHNIPDNPTPYRAKAIPDFPHGIPPFWQGAKDRIAAGKPGPVTKRMTYDNYLLASDKSILNQYSDKIEELVKNDLLPKVSHDVYNFYAADKAYFVGYSPPNKEAWETQLSYLNAGLGTELQGDLHLVITQNAQIQPDSYIAALKAYWSNAAVFGDNAVSKNSIIVALGTDGTKVTWARAITGMPLGNEYMLSQIKSKLEGQPLTPDAIIGQVSSEFYKVGEKTKVRSTVNNGALYRVIWGLDDPAAKFKRVSMSGGGEGDNGSGFGYLKDEIQPSDGQQLLILILALIVTNITWAAGIYYANDNRRSQW